MIAYEVLVNGERKCLASVGARGSLFGALQWDGYPQPHSQEGKSSKVIPSRFSLSGSILHEDDYWEGVRWPELSIKVGDEVTLRVIEISSQAEADTPDYIPPRKTLSEIEAQAREFIEAAYAMLPTPPVETATIRVADYKRLMFDNYVIRAIGKIINLGQVNTVPDPFWKSVAAAAHLLGQEGDRDYCIQRTKHREG